MDETALPVAAMAVAGLAAGRWLQRQDGSTLPAIGTAVALPGRAAGRVAATGMRVTAVAAILAGGLTASAGAMARDAAGRLERIVGGPDLQRP